MMARAYSRGHDIYDLIMRNKPEDTTHELSHLNIGNNFMDCIFHILMGVNSVLLRTAIVSLMAIYGDVCADVIESD